MSLVIEDRTCFSGFCPCLYYNAVLGHVKQDWRDREKKSVNKILL